MLCPWLPKDIVPGMSKLAIDFRLGKADQVEEPRARAPARWASGKIDFAPVVLVRLSLHH